MRISAISLLPNSAVQPILTPSRDVARQAPYGAGREQMKFARNCKVWKATATGPGRYAMEHAKLEGSKLVATNGRVLAVVNVEPEEGDTDGFVPSAALQAAAKSRIGRYDSTARLQANGSVKVATADGVLDTPRPTEGEFPRWQAVIPKDEPKPMAEIGLDPGLLLDLAEAIGRSAKDGKAGVRLVFYGPKQPIKVTVGLSEDAIGYLMPMTFEPR